MATELAKAYVQIVPSADGITGGLESVFNSSSVNQTTQRAGNALGKTLIKGVTTALATGAAVVASAATAMWKGINEVAEVGDNIDKTSQKIGVTTDQFQALAFAAEHCGFETSAFTKAAKTLAKSGYNGTLYEALQDIMQLDDATERTALATELFGAQSAMSMAALLNGEDTIDDFMDQLESLGGLMSEESVRSAAAFEDSLTNLQIAFGGLKREMAGNFLPAITDVMDGITGLFTGDEGATDLIDEGLEEIGELFRNNAPKIAKAITKMIPSLLKVGGEIIIALIKGISESLPEIVPALVETIGELLQEVVKVLPDLINLGVEVFSQLITSIIDYLSDLSWDDIFNGLKDFFEKIDTEKLAMLLGGWAVMKKVSSAIKGVIEGGWDKYGGSISANVKEIAVGFGAAVVLAEGVSELIENNDTEITGAIASLFGYEGTSEQFEDEMRTMGYTPYSELVEKYGDGSFWKTLFNGDLWKDEFLGQITGERWEGEALANREALGEYWAETFGFEKGGVEYNLVKNAWTEGPFMAIKEGIEQSWSNFTGALDTIWERIKSSFNDGVENIKNVFGGIGDWFGGLWDGIKNAFSNVGSWFGNTFASAKNSVTNVWNNIGSWFSGIKDKIVGAFNNFGANIKAKFTEAFNKAKEAFSNSYQVGADVVNGLWNGIGDKLTWLKNKIAGFCSSALSSIKSFFGIHSPSTVMRDEVGKWIPEGMAVGITANSDAVDEAMRDLKTSTMDSVVGFSGELNPSASAESKIDSLVGLLNQYLPELANMNIVLDGDTLVGRTATRMDNALGEIANGNMRGVVIA